MYQKLFKIIIICLCTNGLIYSAAIAATKTTTMPVQASVATICTLTVSALDFGAFTGTQKDVSTTLVVKCNGGTYNIYLNAGSGTGATTSLRKLTTTGGTLNYTLYSDSGRTTLWQDAAGTYVSGTANGANQTYTVYGRVFAQSNPYVGSYSDTITVTLSY